MTENLKYSLNPDEAFIKSGEELVINWKGGRASRLEEAEAMFRQAVVVNPNNIRANIKLGELFLLNIYYFGILDQIDEAYEVFQRAYSINQENSDVY